MASFSVVFQFEMLLGRLERDGTRRVCDVVTRQLICLYIYLFS